MTCLCGDSQCPSCGAAHGTLDPNTRRHITVSDWAAIGSATIAALDDPRIDRVNWCPNYPEDKVKVIINNLNFTSQETSVGKFRVIVEGQDDLLMTKDNMAAEEAILVFNRIKDGITFEKLKEMGFEYF